LMGEAMALAEQIASLEKKASAKVGEAEKLVGLIDSTNLKLEAVNKEGQEKKTVPGQGTEWEVLDRSIWEPPLQEQTTYGKPSRRREELLPILTPAYPSMNSTFNMNNSTKRILLQDVPKLLNSLRPKLQHPRGLKHVPSFTVNNFLFQSFKNIQIEYRVT